MNHKNLALKLLAVTGFLVVLSTSVFAIEIGISPNFYLTNNYFWRIASINDPHIQCDIGLSASLANFEASFTPWLSYNISEKEVNEIDYIFDIGYYIGDLSLGTGAIIYDVTDIPVTTEVYGALDYSIEVAELLSLIPGAKFYYDIQEIKAGYLEASLSIESPKFEYVSLGSILGYDLGQFVIGDEEEAKNKLTTLQLGVTGNYEIIDGVTICPCFTYVLGLSDGIDNTSFAMLRLGFEF